MKLLTIFAVLLLAGFVQAKPRTLDLGDIWTNCGKANAHIKIATVTITPDPPKKGASITVSFNGSVDESVTGGQITLVAKIDGVEVLNNKFDLCDLAKELNFMCPIKQGPLSITTTQEIPGFAPDGTYTGNAIAVDQNGEQLACIKFDFKL